MNLTRARTWGRTALALCLFTAGVTPAKPALAQSALERLERRIRQQQGQPAPLLPDTGPAASKRQPGYLGIVADDTKDRGQGVRILEVRPGSPADKAGLEPDDLIVGLAEMRLTRMSDMAAILQQVPVGGRVTFEVLRDGNKQRIEAVLSAPPPSSPQLPPPPESSAPVARPPGGAGAALPGELPVPGAGPPQSDEDDGPARSNPEKAPAGARVEELERRVAELERRIADLEATLRDLLRGDEKK